MPLTSDPINLGPLGNLPANPRSGPLTSDPIGLGPLGGLGTPALPTSRPYIPTVPVLSLGGIGSSGSIYVPRRILDRNAPIPAAQVPDNLSGAGAIVPIVYGRTRTVALPFKIDASTSIYTLLYIVAQGEVEAFETMWIDGTEVSFSGQTAGTQFTITALDTAAVCNFWLGTSGQNASTWISTHISGYSDTLANYAVIALRMPSAVVQRAPRVEVLLQGANNVKDYTASPVAAGYTDNLGNILIHWVENVMGRTVDAASSAALADACAEDVGNGTSRRVGGIALNQVREVRQTLEVLRAHAGAHVVDTGTGVIFVPDRPVSTYPMDIGEAQIVGDVVIQGPSLRNTVDDVVIHWYNPETGKVQQSRATDTLSGKISDVRMPGITTAAQAKREAVERYNHLSLEGDTLTLTMRNEGAELVPGDVVRITDSRVGLADKPYRIVQMAAPEPGMWQLQCVEYQPNVYSDTVQGDPEIGDTNLDNPLAEIPVALSSLSASWVDSAEKVIKVTGVDPGQAAGAQVYYLLQQVDVFDDAPSPIISETYTLNMTSFEPEWNVEVATQFEMGAGFKARFYAFVVNRKNGKQQTGTGTENTPLQKS